MDKEVHTINMAVPPDDKDSGYIQLGPRKDQDVISEQELQSLIKTAKAPDYEQLLEDYSKDIARDKHKLLLLFPQQDLVVNTVERERRTLTSTVPKEARDAAPKLNLFARRALEFYDGSWTVTERVHRQPSDVRELNAGSTGDDAYEVDVRQSGRIDAATVLRELRTHKTFSTAAIMSDYLSVQRSANKDTTQYTTTVKGGGKWKKRFVVFRFQTSQGNPVFELAKDDKRQSQKEVVSLESFTAVEITETPTTFMVEWDNEVILFQADTGQIATKWTEELISNLKQWKRLEVDSTLSEDPTSRAVEARERLQLRNRAGSRLHGLQQVRSDAAYNQLSSCLDAQARERKRKQAARSNIFEVYPVTDNEAITPEEPEPEPLCERFGRRFLVVCKEVTLGMSLVQGGHPVNPEPLFCTLALFDVKYNMKLSENFCFEIGNEERSAMKLREAIFSVSTPHAQIMLVLMIEKVLQGDVATVADLYTKNADNEKAAKKQAQQAALYRARLGDQRMPFGWAARRVFNDDDELDLEAEFSPIFRHEPDKLQEEDLIRSLSELHRFGKLKTLSIPGKIRVALGPYTDSDSEPTVTSDLTPINAVPSNVALPRREIQHFDPRPVQTAHTTYMHTLYVYPSSVNFGGKKAVSHSKARNIAVSVQLVETDAKPLTQLPEGLPCVFDRHSMKLTRSQTTAVTHHDKNPSFYEEIKIRLPPLITQRHHLFFTFYHVSVDSRKDRKRAGSDQPVGYAFLPLQPLRSQLNRTVDLPVAAAVTYDANGTLLPANYTSGGAAGNGNTSSNGHGHHSGPQLKWIDGGRHLFSVKTRAVTTLVTFDDHVDRFFAACAEKLLRATQRQDCTAVDRELAQRIKALHATAPSALYGFLPIIFDQLLVLFSMSTSLNDEVCANAVRFMIFAVDLLHATDLNTKTAMDSGKNPIIHSYVHHVFDASHVHGSQPIHDKLAYQLSVCLKQTADAGLRNKIVRHSWFFLKIIAKSMYQYVDNLPGSFQSPRAGRFSDTFYDSCVDVFARLCVALIELSRTDIGNATSVNASLADFVLDVFAVCDRGVGLRLVQLFLLIVARRKRQQHSLIMFVFEFLRLVGNYEHFLQLNLVVEVSPDMAATQLNRAYRERHFLASCYLTQFESMLTFNDDKSLRKRAIATLKNLILRHDLDSRFATKSHKQRIAQLYFPLVYMVIRVAPRLRPARTDDVAEGANINMYGDPFTEEEAKDILICFLFVLKNVDPSLLRAFFEKEGPLPSFFECLHLCLQTFKYGGREKLVNSALDAPLHKSQALKLLEEANAIQPRGNRRTHSTSSGSTDRRTKRKLQGRSHLSLSVVSPAPPSQNALARSVSSAVVRRTSTASMAKGDSRSRISIGSSLLHAALNAEDLEHDAAIAASLSTEVCFVVLETIEFLLDEFEDFMMDNGGLNAQTRAVFGVLLAFLKHKPSQNFAPHLFATLHSFVDRYESIIFNPRATYCQDLCFELLRCCNSKLPVLRMYASALLFFLLKANMSRMSVDLMIALSRLAGETREENDENLQLALRSVKDFGMITSLPRNFIEAIDSLMSRLVTVLVNTAQMRRYRADPEMLIDLQYDVAKSYSNSPQLRITWLESMSVIHINEKNWSEAAMCVIHCCAVVAEQLKLQGNGFFPGGHELFQKITSNIVCERYGDDLVASYAEGQRQRAASDGLSSLEKNRFESPLFTEESLIDMLRIAIRLLKRAERYELVSFVYNVFLVYLQEQRQYKDLQGACADMQACFSKILEVQDARKRHLASYFRVGFYGTPFGSLNGQEYIYKEPNVTPLAAISLRLKSQYEQQLGCTVEMITDSKDVDVAKLDPNVCHLQVTYVQPYTVESSIKSWNSDFDNHHDVSKFVFETPYTKGNKARGSVSEQCKRKTIMTLAGDKSFPYLKKRLLVQRPHQTVELDPIECAIEEMTRKVVDLRQVTSAEHPDMKLLQMQLQGIVSLQVNAGPLEYAQTFLSKGAGYPADKRQELEQLFIELVELVSRGLDIDEQLIGADQLEMHENLVASFKELRSTLSKLIPTLRKMRRRSIRGGAHLAAAQRMQAAGPAAAEAEAAGSAFSVLSDVKETLNDISTA